MLVNVVSDFSQILEAQENFVLTDISFIFTKIPVDCEVHVVVGQTGAISFPQTSIVQIFVAVEPPEIFRYDVDVLRMYTATIGPRFRYLKGLKSHFSLLGVLPWRIGYDSETANSSENVSMPQTVTKEAGPAVSAVISAKSTTKKQKERILLSRILEKSLESFQLFGRGTNRILDKADAHRSGWFHLAIENSHHPLYNTEKLFDAILMKNIVFYDGHPEFLRYFRPDQFCFVNSARPKSALRRIRKHSASASWIDLNATLEHNRDLVLRKFNLYSNIASVLGQINFEVQKNSDGGLLEIPPHQRGFARKKPTHFLVWKIWESLKRIWGQAK